ncbi:MAG: flagellar hook assembly protein FlgD [Burkholderiales bacterium]
MTTMQTIPGTTGATAAAGAGTTDATNKLTSDSADRFMTLLISQIQNQDPLNPMDNAQMTSQLAQISTVNGISKLNDTLSTLASSLTSSQYLRAAGLVGHEVAVKDDKLQLVADGAHAGFELPQSADKVTVTITSPSGQVVRKLELGPTQAGISTFDWDGRTDSGAAAKEGMYVFNIDAEADGDAVSADTLTYGRVDGVVSGDSGAQLQLGALGPVDMNQVRQIN